MISIAILFLFSLSNKNNKKALRTEIKFVYYGHNLFIFLFQMKNHHYRGILLLFSILSLSVSFASFSDTIGHPYQSDITQLSEFKIVQWYPGNIFKPDQAVTRAEMLKIIMWGAKITTTKTSKKCFSDIEIDARYTDYVCTAKSMGIIAWYADGTFQPNKAVSNVEWMKIALNSFKIIPKKTNGTERYSDYINFMHQNNIFSRYSIYPNSAMTRGMMAHLTTSIINQWNLWRGYNRVNNSAGCKVPQNNTAPTSVIVNGISRSIITDIGNNYNQSKPAKLIIAFHGRTNPNSLVRTYYKIDKASDGNTIIVYPSGLPEEWPTRSRQDPGDKSNNLRDYALFDEVVATIENQYCINQDEIYVVWHSLGGRFSNMLACARWDVIRAIGSVWGSSTTNNACTWPTSAIIMHHPEDSLASFAGGEQARDKLLTQNQCDITKNEPTWPEWWNCLKYTSCIEWSEVVRCPHNDSIENGRYYPHKRPSFAGTTIREFFTNTL